MEEAVDRLSAEARKLKQFSELIALQTSSPKVFIDGETMRALADSSEIDVR